MTDDILNVLPVRRGHFVLESGYHAELWFNLDALFRSPGELAPLVSALAKRLAPYRPDAVCGPLLGGAFLAQALAIEMNVHFYYSTPASPVAPSGLFSANYEIPIELQKSARGERVALVDDIISAGSSVRATASALARAKSSLVAVGSLVLLGTRAEEHFKDAGVPIEALQRCDFNSWAPDKCPACQLNQLLEDPLSVRTRSNAQC